MSAPWLTQTDLFEAYTAGYRCYRIPGIVVTAKGTFLAYCEARRTTGSDWDDIDILMRRSLDGGATWEPAQTLVRHDIYGPGPANNPCAIADQRTGAIHFLYCYNYAHAFYMRSDDEGATFSPPVGITATFESFRPEYDWGVLAVGPGHGIQLQNGRLIVPIWLSESKTLAHRPNRAAVIYSDDHGATWRRGEMIAPTIPNCNESEAVQLEDGSVLLNIRNEGKEYRRAVAISSDGIGSWTEPKVDWALVDPRCFASICRFTTRATHGKSRILFSNPCSPTERKNLTIRMSYDECVTWSVSKVLDSGPSGYSDLAIAPDQTVLCFYERGTLEGRPRYLTLARFNLEWLTDGKDQLG